MAEITGSQRRNGATEIEPTEIGVCLHRALRGEDALTTGIRSINNEREHASDPRRRRVL